MTTYLPARLVGLALILSATSAQAAILKLEPADTRIGLTIYAMGMFAQAGHFSRFTGTMTVDPGHPESCHVALQIEVASLAMSTDASTRTALGASMLDAAHFPTLTYRGDCDPAHTAGQLTLHGITRALSLTTARESGTLTSTGSLHRQDYAIRGMPGLVGGTVRIVFSVDVPPDLAQSFPR